MKRTSTAVLASTVGFVLMAAGYVQYVRTCANVYTGVFVLGLAMLIGSYAYLWLSSKRIDAKLAEIAEKEAVDGYVYYMDGEKAPMEATITDLQRKRDDRPRRRYALPAVRFRQYAQVERPHEARRSHGARQAGPQGGHSLGPREVRGIRRQPCGLEGRDGTHPVLVHPEIRSHRSQAPGVPPHNRRAQQGGQRIRDAGAPAPRPGLRSALHR